MNKLILLLLLTIFPGIFFGQNPDEPGFPFLKNYSPAEYHAHPQNFAIIADRQGMIYTGNFAGVMQFDGSEWRLIPTAKTTKVSALAIDSAGTIFVGARGEFGMLAADETGGLVFKNLMNDEKSSLPAFSDIRHIFITPGNVMFVSESVIFILKEGKITTWKSTGSIIGSFYLNNIVFLQIQDKGLMKFDGTEVAPVQGGEIFSGAIQIQAILPLSDQKNLIVTGTQGLYAMQPSGISRINAAANQFLMQNPVTCGEKLPDGTFALGTSREGIAIVDGNGNLLKIIDKRAGLRNNFIQGLYLAKNNLLWAALNNGLAFIEIPSPYSFFDDKSGLSGAVNHITRFDNTLYISTYQGLFYYDRATFGFLPVSGIITACWIAIPFENYLLAATSQGVFQVKNRQATRIREGFALSMAVSAKDPSTVYIGEMDGLYSLRKAGNQWISQKIEGPEDEINDLQADASGNIWGSTILKGVFRYTPGEKAPEFFTRQSGLPEDEGCSINRIGIKMSVSTSKGVYFFNEQTRKFDSVSLINGNETTTDQWFPIITPASDHQLWVNMGDEKQVMQLVKEGKGYTPLSAPFASIADYVIWAIFPESAGLTWFGGPDGLIRYDQSTGNKNVTASATLIRKIVLNNDSVLYNGNVLPGAGGIEKKKLVFSPSDNTIMFKYSSPYYNSKGVNKYQYRLEGFDETWSEWTEQTQKEYTNLPAGIYTFRVKSRNIFGEISPEVVVSFRILSPWYTSIWAIILYVVAAGGIIYIIVILRNQQLIREKRVLEQRIADRTAEVVQQKEELLSQSEELANKNDELEKINNAVKSINAEVNFENLLQAMLEKMQVLRPVEKSMALVFDKSTNTYRFKAGIGYNLQLMDKVNLTFIHAENRFLKNSEEVFEDIFLKIDFSDFQESPDFFDQEQPKSMVVLVLRVEKMVEAFIILENYTRSNAFEQKELSFLKNSKEHIISAFIRTRILEDLQETLQNLKATQDQLVQSEKLASLGQLTAGIAHEIQNPLNFVNNFSSLSADLAGELLDFLNEIKDSLSEDKYADIEEVIGMLKGNMKKINEHGKRAESIVKGMLQHSRGKTGEFETIEINNMVAEYVNLAYHGMRAKDKSFNTAIRTNLDPAVGSASIIPQDLSRVILNIVNNACYAVDEKAKKHTSGYSPEVMISTKKTGNKIEIHIRDNGTGMPDSVKEKIFNPFFTTKPTGKGTGLGLSMSFDIVNQVHKGKLEVVSQDGEFTEFIITIPEKQATS